MILVVVEREEDWPLEMPGVEVVLARTYLTAPYYSALRTVRVVNLCRSVRYQSVGYYVSLLAEARNHRPLPGVGTLEDLGSPALLRVVADDLEELATRSLKSLAAQVFDLSIYFGQNVARRHRRLAQALFGAFPAPLLRAHLERRDNGRWRIVAVRALEGSDIPDEHREVALAAAADYFAGRRPAARPRPPAHYDLAILVDPDEAEPPSDERAIQRFVKAAGRAGLAAEVIGPDDLARHLGEFDALFLRETTRVHHHTYRLARQAEALGLVVIDDPASILHCGNKVFLAERLERARIATPESLLVHRDNLASVPEALGLPVVLKSPDSSFSLGVFRVETTDELEAMGRELLESSELLLAQRWTPTQYDWRVGVLDRRLLYACRYHMAPGHWQIVQRSPTGRRRYGRVETLPVEDAPRAVTSLALRAANLMGDGLYGVDLKEVDGRAQVIEVNDNPTLQAGIEDEVLGDELYDRLMTVFHERLETARGRRGRRGER